jgi:cell division control protein 6
MSQPILIDETVFDEAFIPERLVCREGQIKEIARCLSPIKNGKSARNLFIYGSPGTGKTSVCKWILNEHFPKNSVYVNCWSKRTLHKIMEGILLQIGQLIHGRESASELTRRFEKIGKRLLIFLDESDHIKEPDILYVLARVAQVRSVIKNYHHVLHHVKANFDENAYNPGDGVRAEAGLLDQYRE